MIYTCNVCGFIFERVSEPEQCPDCGKIHIRPAVEPEKIEYRIRINNPDIVYDEYADKR